MSKVSSTNLKRLITVAACLSAVFYFSINFSLNPKVDFLRNSTYLVSTATNDSSHHRNSARSIRKQNIVFIKLMKVGGTTLQSILFRYAQELQLSVADLRDRFPTKRNLFAQHLTLQKYLRNPVVVKPVFITLLRNPLEHACSLFYWNWNTNGYGKQFRREARGNFSAEHLHFLSIFTRQNASNVFVQHAGKAINLTYKHQWEWFGSTPDQAIDNLVTMNFTVGFMEVSSLRLRIITARDSR
jgi:hypothetical protein